MKRTSMLAVFGLVFAALGCPPRDNENFPDETLPKDRLVIIERTAESAEPVDRTVIIERAEQLTEKAAAPNTATPDESAVQSEPEQDK